MKRLKSVNFSIIVLCIVASLSGPCFGEDEEFSAPMKKSEKENLFSTIQGFVGTWWNGSDLYPDPCGWTPIQGVSCDLFNGFWYVTDINIGPVHDNSLTCDKDVKFTSHLYALRHLKLLSFYNCFVSREKSVSIQNQEWELLAESLESLEFRSNSGLTGGIPASFGMLKRLKSLVLMENGLTGNVPENLGNLTDLKRLNLAGNSFTGGIPTNFGRMKQLLILDISRNSLFGEIPRSLGGLISLLKLDLSCNQLTGSIPEEMGNLKNLTLLDLSNNILSGGLSKAIQELSSLQELILSNNPSGGEVMTLQWRNLMSLTVIGLSNMSLTGRIPDTITELKALRFLGLNDNRLIGEIPPKLGTLPNITAIYIQGNNLTGELKFSEVFYSRLGRRFKAWGNLNLCFTSDELQPSNVPFGVKLCAQNTIRYQTNNAPPIGNSDHDQISVASSLAMASLPSSVCRFLVLISAVEVLIMTLDFNL